MHLRLDRGTLLYHQDRNSRHWNLHVLQRNRITKIGFIKLCNIHFPKHGLCVFNEHDIKYDALKIHTYYTGMFNNGLGSDCNL